MRLPNRLRALRGERTLTELERALKAAGLKGVTVAELSRMERGHELPRDHWRTALEAVYGAPRHEWYAPEVLVVLERDDPGGRHDAGEALPEGARLPSRA